MTEHIVEFETVRQRFDEAVKALEEQSELMAELRRTEETRERTTAAISEASDALREAATTIKAYCDQMGSVLEATRKALQAAENQATGVELAAVRTELSSNAEVLTRLVDAEAALETKHLELSDQQGIIREMVEALQTKIADDLAGAQESLEKTSEELADTKQRLEKREFQLAALPDRFRRKYGLDNL